MIIEEIKKIKSNKKEWRKFGLTVGFVLGLLGLFLAWRGNNLYPYFLAVSGALVVFGLVIPKILNPIHKIWMTFAFFLGWIMSYVLLTIIFFLLVTPLGLLARLMGKDFLDRKFRKNETSYWILKEQGLSQKSSYEKQF